MGLTKIDIVEIVKSVAVKILVAVKNPTHEKIYHETIRGYGFDCCIVDSLEEAVKHASSEPHSGVFIDMQLMIKVPKSIIDGIGDLLSGLPSATLNINNNSSETIRILSRGELSSECFSIEQLMAVCTQFIPKIIYFRKRELVYYNVLLDRNPEFNSPNNKTVCIDISHGGCFVFCVWEDVAIGDDVWIKLPETVQPLPVRAVVCWIRKWGTCQDIPGIGVEFM